MFFMLVALVLSFSCLASERILLFKSDITVHSDASMSVVETIQVRATGDTIRHGIVREFPTEYKDSRGIKFKVAFQVEAVMRDGQKEGFRIESVSNGKKVYIGSKDVMLSPGIYTYTITYNTNRQLGFFKDHDELYWNVTGNGWRLPIDKVVAIVHLPPSIPHDQIKLEAYTGSQGSQGQDYRASTDAQGAAVFETTRTLRIYQGLTIVVTWPKGYITPPSWWQEWWDFFKDNLHIFIAILGLLCLLGWYLFAWIRVRATQYIDTVIPLFYPPKDMTPGLMRYIIRMKYDAVVLASDIVDMAVHGFLTIEYKAGFVWNQYILHKKQAPKADMPHYVLLFDTLFGKNDSISLDTKNAQRVDAAINLEKKWYQKICNDYFQSSGWYTFGGVLVSIIFSLGLLSLVDDDSRYVFFIAVCFYIWLNIWFFSLLSGYSKEGLRIKKEIDGFKMFLATTEEERLKIIGTPPTKTPELYEKYLPYAMALGVEKQWSAQFAPLFEEMRASGHPYVSVWYMGDFRSFNSSSLASTISNSVSSSSISSSSSRPGSSSGSGGGGSSGGGGGGGGGGGW